MLQAANVPLSAPPASYSLNETGQIFPPMRARVFTNKLCDWLGVSEGGIFQPKSQWKLQPTSVKPPKVDRRRRNAKGLCFQNKSMRLIRMTF